MGANRQRKSGNGVISLTLLPLNFPFFILDSSKILLEITQEDKLYYLSNVNGAPVVLVFTARGQELIPHADQTIAGFAALDWLEVQYSKGQVKEHVYQRIKAEFE